MSKDFQHLYEEEYAIVDRCWKALGMDTFHGAQGKTIDEHIAKLRARVRELSSMLDLPDHEKSCGELTCDECTDRYLAQKARIRELEVEFDRNTSCIASYSNQVGYLLSRIRELEEAMPDFFTLKVIAGACNELKQHNAEASLLKMSDRIEKAMKR